MELLQHQVQSVLAMLNALRTPAPNIKAGTRLAAHWHETDARMLFPRGCTCRDDSQYCDYCQVLLYGPEYAIYTSPVEVA